MNLGVIILDTLGYQTAIEEMPSLWARADRVFTSMYSTSRWTTPAHASLFTGLYPTEVGTHAENKHLTTSQLTLPERLRDAGYETVGLTENVNVDRFFGFDRGFRRFIRSPGLSERPESNAGNFDWQELEATIPDSGVLRPLTAVYRIFQSDMPTIQTLSTGLEMFWSQNEGEETIDWAIDQVRELSNDSPENLFLFLNLMTCHYPYHAPAGYASSEPLDVQPLELTVRDDPVSVEEKERQIDCYRGCARYLDEMLPGLIDAIDWDVLFILSDHGELFGEYGLWGHQYGVYEELTHVPAVALGDAVPEGKVDEQTSILDVHRTLLHVAGMKPGSSARGVPLFAPDINRADPVYAESVRSEWFSPDATGIEARVPHSWDEEHYMLRTDRGMLIVDKDGTRAIDPDSGDVLPDRVERSLLADVEALRASRQELSSEASPSDEVPTAIKDRLESLGYR